MSQCTALGVIAGIRSHARSLDVERMMFTSCKRSSVRMYAGPPCSVRLILEHGAAMVRDDDTTMVAEKL